MDDEQAAEALSDDAGSEQLENLLAEYPASHAVHQRILRHNACDERLLSQLALLGSPVIQVLIAENPDTGDRTLSALARHRYAPISTAILDRPNLSESVLRSLADSPLTNVRHRIACHWSTPPEALTLLAFDSDPVVSKAAGRSLRSRHAS